MEFFKANTNINFLGLRKLAAMFSIILFIASIGSLIINGLNFGLDFTGGTQIELVFSHPADVNKIRKDLQDASFKEVQVQSFGDSKTVLVTLPADKMASKKATFEDQENEQKKWQENLVSTVSKAIPDAKFNSVNFVGAKVSSELAYKGILAVVVAMLATMIYIALRFEWRLAVGAAVSLVHDPILILGVFSFFHVQFDLVSLAGVLTILGYSLHDTIVIFDRIRENFRRIRRGTTVEIVNMAINQTLSRTVISSGLTLSVVVILFLLGGPAIYSFSLALIIGIVIGTYSSIYVAGSVAVTLGLNRTDLLVSAKKDYDE